VPTQPVFIQVGFTGPATTNTLGKAFFENVTGPYGPVAVGTDGSIAASPFEGTGPTSEALLALRQTLTFDQRKASVRDALAYSASVGITTHLDQGAFQATNTPSDGAAHEDNYTMYNPFLSVYGEGDQRDVDAETAAFVRLRTNYLLFDTDPTIPVATARLQNAFPFFGSDLVRTGAIGEFLADISLYAGGNATWQNAALAVAKAGWRAEVHSLSPTDFQTEIAGYEAVNAEVDITGLRWVVAHVPFITAVREFAVEPGGPGRPAPAHTTSHTATVSPVTSACASKSAMMRCEVDADPGASGDGLLGHRVAPVALAAAAHHDQVARGDCQRYALAALSGPDQEAPGGAEAEHWHRAGLLDLADGVAVPGGRVTVGAVQVQPQIAVRDVVMLRERAGDGAQQLLRRGGDVPVLGGQPRFGDAAVVHVPLALLPGGGGHELVEQAAAGA